jgi:hypothetical protein
LSASYLLVDSEWCLCIGDDDCFTAGALKKVLADIDNMEPDICAVRYSIVDSYIHDDCRIDNISSYINYYWEHKKFLNGELYYLGLLQNMRLMRPYMFYMTNYAYNAISFICPFLKALSDKKYAIRMSSFPVFKYYVNENWSSTPESFIRIALNVRTFFDIPYALPVKQLDSLRRIVTGHILSYKRVYKQLLQIKDNKFKLDALQSLLPYLDGPIFQKTISKYLFYLILRMNLKYESVLGLILGLKRLYS